MCIKFQDEKEQIKIEQLFSTLTQKGISPYSSLQSYEIYKQDLTNFNLDVHIA